MEQRGDRTAQAVEDCCRAAPAGSRLGEPRPALAYSSAMPSGPRRVDAGTGGPAGDSAGGSDAGSGEASFPVRPRRAAAPSPGRGGARRVAVPVPPEQPRRWRWRQRLRRDRPRVYRLYRVGVGVVGGLLLVAWVMFSWVPGPGGIPLLLLALAVLSTEFRWARRLLARARVGAHHFAQWTARLPVWTRVLGSTALVVVVLTAAALGLAVALGLPGWVPEGLALQLVRLPGVDTPG